MKAVKKVFYALMILCMLLCMMVLVCALVPGMTDKIAVKLYGETGAQDSDEGGDQSLIYPDYTITSSTTAGLNWDNMPFHNNAGYVVPVKEDISVPEDVKGKNGYQGIRENTSEIGDQEAENLAEELGNGELGEDLQFYDLYYPYYAMLNSSMQELYRQIYANADNLTDTFQPIVDVTESELYSVFEALTGDHPELFWLDTGYQCKRARNGKIVEITLLYYDLTNRLDSAKREFEQAAERILAGARELETELEQEKYVHDALAESVEYSLSAQMNQSAYSSLVNGKTVCAGYARAFQYLMQQLGIPCYYCTGYSGEDHAWNIIYIDGLFRNVDVTWDDGETITYEYYNCSDKAFQTTHMRKGLSVYLPACQEDGSTQAQVSALDGIKNLINTNPIKPITLEDPGEIFPESGTAKDTSGSSDASSSALNELELRKAGISAADVLLTLDAYYKDCEEKMVKAGTGQIAFENCIPATLWDKIENAYSTEAYKSGYATNAMKTLGVEEFAITIQAVRLSGGFYKLYHIIATW